MAAGPQRSEKPESEERLVLVTGGARSGKSAFAQAQAEGLGKRRVFLATAQARDREMTERIARHREARDPTWSTVEEPVAVAEGVAALKASCDVILLDCLTLWLANLMETGAGPEDMEARVEELARACREPGAVVVAVTNEVGSGIVPENPQARAFRDAAGRANQAMAAAADRVVVVIAGLPLVLKE